MRAARFDDRGVDVMSLRMLSENRFVDGDYQAVIDALHGCQARGRRARAKVSALAAAPIAIAYSRGPGRLVPPRNLLTQLAGWTRPGFLTRSARRLHPGPRLPISAQPR